MGEASDAIAPMGAPVLQFSVFLQNRAGSLEALIQLLHQSRVELLGFSVQDSRDATVARIVTSDPESTQQIFLEKGIPHTTADLVVVALRHAELRVGESAGTPRAVAGLAQLEALVAAFERVRQAGDLALRRRDLAIDGKEVMRLLGCGPGPHVGRTLAFLTHCVVEDPSRNTPETLHRLVETLAAEPKGGDKS